VIDPYRLIGSHVLLIAFVRASAGWGAGDAEPLGVDFDQQATNLTLPEIPDDVDGQSSFNQLAVEPHEHRVDVVVTRWTGDSTFS
jgi:hypothetical protein